MRWCAPMTSACRRKTSGSERLRAREPYRPGAALLIDDSLPVLRAARAAGIGQVLAVSRPDSRHPPKAIAEFPAVADLRDVLPA